VRKAQKIAYKICLNKNLTKIDDLNVSDYLVFKSKFPKLSSFIENPDKIKGH